VKDADKPLGSVQTKPLNFFSGSLQISDVVLKTKGISIFAIGVIKRIFLNWKNTSPIPKRPGEFLEAQRWPDGVVCPFCGVVGESYRLKAKQDSKTPVRPGVWKCGGCRKQFTVTVGTVFEDSHISLNVWLLAMHLLCASKKCLSAHQLHRMLGVTYKTAWFMAHRIRYAMTQDPLAEKLAGIVEIDETYIGGKLRTGQHAVKIRERAKDRPHPNANKAAVFALLERGGRIRSQYVERVTAKNLRPIIDAAVAENAAIMTDSGTVLQSGLPDVNEMVRRLIFLEEREIVLRAVQGGSFYGDSGYWH